MNSITTETRNRLEATLQELKRRDNVEGDSDARPGYVDADGLQAMVVENGETFAYVSRETDAEGNVVRARFASCSSSDDSLINCGSFERQPDGGFMGVCETATRHSGVRRMAVVARAADRAMKRINHHLDMGWLLAGSNNAVVRSLPLAVAAPGYPLR
jgi:hypothetical protein